MKKAAYVSLYAIATLLLGSFVPAPLSATSNGSNKISFDSFNAIYNLQRNPDGLSLLTSNETIIADFPPSGFAGITRYIPKSYQSHPVNVKVLNVKDASGNPVPYKTTDSNDALVLTTGDPDITLVGLQTVKITYQTSGVIDLGQKTDELLLDVNGRGWSQPFNSVEATLIIPSYIISKMNSSPACYTALGSAVFSNCQLSTEQTDNLKITAKTGPLAAYQTLVIKADFKPTTFTNNQYSLSWWQVAAVIIALALAIGAATRIYLKKMNPAGKKLSSPPLNWPQP